MKYTNLDYADLLDIHRNPEANAGSTILKVLSPGLLEKPEDLEKMVSAKYRYTGPGKWYRVIREKYTE